MTKVLDRKAFKQVFAWKDHVHVNTCLIWGKSFIFKFIRYTYSSMKVSVSKTMWWTGRRHLGKNFKQNMITHPWQLVGEKLLNIFKFIRYTYSSMKVSVSKTMWWTGRRHLGKNLKQNMITHSWQLVGEKLLNTSRYHLLLAAASYYVGSTDRASSQQLQMWFSEHFSRQNLLRSLSRLLFLPRWNKYGAKKCMKNHIPFDFWDDSTLANQKAGKTIEKPLKELPSNQQIAYLVIWRKKSLR